MKVPAYKSGFDNCRIIKIYWVVNSWVERLKFSNSIKF